MKIILKVQRVKLSTMSLGDKPAGKPRNRKKIYGKVKGPYSQRSIKARIEALFLDNLGKVVTREQLIQVATDPRTGRVPENWHQRLSELRTDEGYTVLSWRNGVGLKVSEYVMSTPERRPIAKKRARPTSRTWLKVLERADYRCEWGEGGVPCGLREGEIDPIGGGKVKLTPDHMIPHAITPETDPEDPNKWRALCGRHQVMKKNYWDSITGKLNVYAIVQAASRKEKRKVYEFLEKYFGEK